MAERNEDDPLFMQLILMWQQSAYALLGKTIHPVTGKIERDLPQAKVTIDLLQMLNRKTEGNRSPDEDRLLRGALSGLQLNYVDELSRPAPAPEAPESAPEPESVPSEEGKA